MIRAFIDFLRAGAHYWRTVSPVPWPLALLIVSVTITAAALRDFYFRAEKDFAAAPLTLPTAPTGGRPADVGDDKKSQREELYNAIALGDKFFRRVVRFSSGFEHSMTNIRSWMGFHRMGELPSNWTPDRTVISIDEFEELAEWWNKEGTRLYYPFVEEWPHKYERFRQLSREIEVGDAQLKLELDKLIGECGGEWLMVPNDGAFVRRQFFLDEPLPDHAPEKQLQKLERLSDVIDQVRTNVLNGRAQPAWGPVPDPDY